MILDNKDLNLKLRLKRILFQMGYYSPIEVELSQYDDTGLELKRTSLTDLDVLGIKFDPALISHKVVGDCKTGKGVSDLNRLFLVARCSRLFWGKYCLLFTFESRSTGSDHSS